MISSSTTSHLALSFSDANEPIYLILVTTCKERYTFPEVDVNFIRNIGSILLAKSVQARVMLADSAKTSFLSAISHELRTPMHAVTHSHTLMQEALNAEAYSDLGPLLELSASSSRTLTNILNDVLDFGKDTTGYYRQDHETFVSNLADTTSRIFKITETQYLDEAGTVDLIVEYEDRDWGVHIDEARFSR
jgi:signal transduction histidine kinase